MTTKRNLIIIGTLVVVAAALFRPIKKNFELLRVHRTIESTYPVNESQKKELLPLGENDARFIYRYLDANNTWQVTPANIKGQGGVSRFMPIGVLHMHKAPPQITRPVFLCRYVAGNHESLSLDGSPTCPGGRLAQPEPLGYVSGDIRTGYLLLGRCIDPKRGRYLTLNLKCESPDDHLDGKIGVIRAAKIQ